MDTAGPPDITSTFGAALVGCLGMMGLYGVTSVQTYIYFAFYPDDGIGLKSLVWLIWLLDSFHIALVCHGIYHYLVTNYGNPAVLAVGVWSLWLSIIVNCLIGCIVQTFFTARLYVLMSRKSRTIVIPIIAVFVVCHLAFGIETAAWGFMLKLFMRLREKIWMSALPFAIFAVASDIIIALSLCIALHRSKSYLMTTNTLINHLIIFSINRCLLTAVVAIVEVILFAVFPHALWYLGLDFVIGKLYANSLLATLNTRYSVRARGQSTSDGSSPGTGTRGTGGGSGGNGLGNGNGMGNGVPSLRASGVDGRGALFSTVIQMGQSTLDEESLGDDRRSLDLDDERCTPTGKSRPITPMSADSDAFEMAAVR